MLTTKNFILGSLAAVVIAIAAGIAVFAGLNLGEGARKRITPAP